MKIRNVDRRIVMLSNCEMFGRANARTHGANKSSLFAQIFDPYKVNLFKFAQTNDGLFGHVYKA